MVLRPVAEGDDVELLRIHRTPEVMRWWDVPDEGFPWTDDPESTRLTIEVDGKIAGMVQYWEEADPKYRHAGIDIFLDPALHGRGLGTEAVRRVVRLLIEERGHHRITIDPAAENAAAIRAYEKAGFRPVGVMKKYERDTGGAGWRLRWLVSARRLLRTRENEWFCWKLRALLAPPLAPSSLRTLRSDPWSVTPSVTLC
jgi:aminoglycoside 6'-N-acetyltransferase